MQLSFAVIPLVMFTSEKLKMGEFVNPPWMKVSGWLLAIVIAVLNAFLLWQTFTGSTPTYVPRSGPAKSWSRLPAFTGLGVGGLLVIDKSATCSSEAAPDRFERGSLCWISFKRP